jgi:hypothetical protein
MCLYFTASCGPPSPPPNGFIFPYSSTVDGAVVNFTCQKSASFLDEAAVCSKQGKWDPDPAEFCTLYSALGDLYYHFSKQGECGEQCLIFRDSHTTIML